MPLVMTILSCSKDGIPDSGAGIGPESDYLLAHDMIVLGEKLENPYKTENVRRAYSSLYPTRSGSDISTNNLYVRFLPETPAEYELLESIGLELFDHPVDYEILKDGDYYHDPAIAEDDFTWQYAVVPEDFEFPDVKHEVLDECFIADSDIRTRSGEVIDWSALETEAYRITGNADRLVPESRAQKSKPSGRLTIVDSHANGGKPFGISGVRVRCNTFVKIATAYTDRDGYYQMKKNFSAKVNYRIVFKNERGFAIGFNKVIVPASTSALGKSGPEGLSVTVSTSSDRKLFNRSTVNNAAYDYIGRCGEDDMDIAAPPSDLRIWLFSEMTASSAVMLHHGAVVQSSLLSGFLGIFADIISFFAPDITIGTKGNPEYRDLYSTVCHELAHASHFSRAGKDYWNNYILFVLSSWISSGGTTYGSGTESLAGYCEVGEMWAYYLESEMYKDRYGGQTPSFGTSFWFRPQIFRYLDDRGISRSDIFGALDADVADISTLEERLKTVCPGKESVIEQAFRRYN